MRPRISIRGCVRPSVCPSVCPSVRPYVRMSVCHALFFVLKKRVYTPCKGCACVCLFVCVCARQGRIYCLSTKLVLLQSVKFRSLQEYFGSHIESLSPHCSMRISCVPHLTDFGYNKVEWINIFWVYQVKWHLFLTIVEIPFPPFNAVVHPVILIILAERDGHTDKQVVR